MGNEESRKMAPGFTLIELVIVVTIIAVLAAILISSLGQRPLLESRDAKRLSDIQSMRLALTLYYTDNNNSYPVDTSSLASTLVPTYIPTLPRDPRHDDSGCDTSFLADNRFPSAVDSNGDYGYRYIASGGIDYVLQACLEDATNEALRNDCDDTSATPPCFGNSVRVYDFHS